MPQAQPAHKRILLKLSGEALMGDDAFGINRALTREDFERQYLTFHLARFGGNISRTAGFVGMDRAALHRKLTGLGVHNAERIQKTGA